MIRLNMRDRRLAALAFAAAMAGCDEEQVRHYRVPKPEAQPAEAKPHGEAAPRRMLAAIVPHGDRTWFFKLEGPAAPVSGQKAAFDGFIRSIHLGAPDGQDIAWTAPSGWQQRPPSGMRYATFQIETGAAPLELTVTPLGREAGAVLPNVNRWRGQLRLPPIGDGDLERMTARVPVDGGEAVVVDLSGSGGAPALMAPPAGAGGASPQPAGVDARQPPFRFSAPEGWQAIDPGAMSVAAFQVSEGARQAKVTVVPLSGAAGGLLANVNRWRGQIGLDPVGEDALKADERPLEVEGRPATYVDMTGSPSADGARLRILGVVYARDSQTWFFKMQGPEDLVQKQKAAFEAFVRSVRF